MNHYQQLGWQYFEFTAFDTATSDPVNNAAAEIETKNDTDESLKNQPIQETGDTTGTYQNKLESLEVTGISTLLVGFSTTITDPVVGFGPSNPLPLTLVDPATLSSDIQYCTVSDLYARFGTENINQWADLDNKRDIDDIANTIINQIAISSDYVNAKIRNKKYAVPFDSPYPLQIVEITTLHAGTQLHSNRGIDDVDGTMAELRNRAEWLIRDILAGRIQLDISTLTDDPQDE